jgi:hypothetical protein
MADETFAVNLMRAIVAELHVLNLQTCSREMLGRSYFSLGIGDKMAVDQVVLALVGGNYSGVTPEWLAGLSHRSNLRASESQRQAGRRRKNHSIFSILRAPFGVQNRVSFTIMLPSNRPG